VYAWNNQAGCHHWHCRAAGFAAFEAVVNVCFVIEFKLLALGLMAVPLCECVSFKRLVFLLVGIIQISFSCAV
jgi:type III secretory pathway component EscR